MDDVIMTLQQRLRARALAILDNMDQEDVIVKDGAITVADIAIMTRNREWSENGTDGLHLVESQARQS